MNKQLKKALCYGVAHGLKCRDYDEGLIYVITPRNLEDALDGNGVPIFRNWSDLMEEITHKGAFLTPLIELAKIYLPSEAEIHEFYIANGYAHSCSGLVFGYESDSGFYVNDKTFHEQENQIKLFEKLREWHFNVDNVPNDLCIYESELEGGVYE